MNNLLRTLARSQVNPDDNLKVLLATVKESRIHSLDSSKLSDPFYESLEGLLNDLKTVSIDNHDAEPFLRPVLRSDAPDYYEVITTPMDFQTMLKKVKQKQYKSKREFKDDLDLIWANCFTYNASENHPLRQCAKRLQAKAEVLLRNVTDRKERSDIPIPPQLAAPHRPPPVINGSLLNGHGHTHSRSPSVGLAATKPAGAIATKSVIQGVQPGKAKAVVKARCTPAAQLHPVVDIGVTPAILRTREGMKAFMDLERRALEIDQSGNGMVKIEGVDRVDNLEGLLDDLDRVLSSLTDEGNSDREDSIFSESDVGLKRKLNDSAASRPRKRNKVVSPILKHLAAEDEITNKWWSAVQTDSMLGNGLPHLPFPHSSHHLPKSLTEPSESSVPTPRRHLKRKRRRKEEEGKEDKRLLCLMNNNIRTLKRIRNAHSKLAALAAASGAAVGEDGPDGDPTGDTNASLGAHPTHRSHGPPLPVIPHPPPIDDPELDKVVDDRPWRLRGRGIRGGISMGRQNADDCVRWAGKKVLEHVGFQGTSESALQVMVGVASEYLMNVGRTIQFLSEKYAKQMTPEEIILHTLFESGVEDVGVLERYISDDVERHGHRLGELEKKLVGAYNDVTTTDGADDEGLFDEDEEDASLAMGDFADLLGEDYLGLRELGLMSEFGMSSLTIPRRLLRGKRLRNNVKGEDNKFKPPPLPYPPPEPFVPLDSTSLEKQIGLLQPYLRKRFTALAGKAIPPPPQQQPQPPPVPILRPPTLSGPGLPSLSATPAAGSSQQATIPSQIPVVQQLTPVVPPTPQPPPILVLPDDQPSPLHIKMGPLGQIIKPGASAHAKKKAAALAKASAAASGSGSANHSPNKDGRRPGDGGGAAGPVPSSSSVPLPTVAVTGGPTMAVNGASVNGAGAVGKKKPPEVNSPRPAHHPPPPSNGASGAPANGKQTPVLPPVVAASA